MARPSTREKLLDCAEQMFADHGLEGVSLRAINAEAGLSPAALHYHFGTKQALVEALLERRMPALMERRRLLLDGLDAKATGPASVSARHVLDALMRPMAEMLAEGGRPGLRYLRFIHRLRSDGDIDEAFVAQRYPGGVDRLVPLFERALPHLPRPLIRFRMGLAIDVMLRSLATSPEARGPELVAHAEALLDFVTGAMEAPVRGETR